MDYREISGARRRALIDSPLLTLAIALTAFLLAYELVRANDPKLLTVRLVGVPTAALLLAASVLAYGFREHSARSTAPLLRYVSRWVSETTRQVSGPGARFWQVRIGNAGGGPALIESLAWNLVPMDGKPASVESARDLQQYLAGLGLDDARDYWIANYTRGMALSPHDDRCYFECTEAAIRRLVTFEAVFECRSLLGDRFEKRVLLVPHEGASDVVTTTRADAAV